METPYENFKRMDLIAILRKNPSYLPVDVIKYSKEKLIEILNSAVNLDLSLIPSFVQLKLKPDIPKTKLVKVYPLEIVKAVVKQPVVLDEITDDDEEEPEIVVERKSRLVRKKVVAPKPVVEEIVPVIKVEIVPVVKVEVVTDTKVEELKVRELLKTYAKECRSLLDNYDDTIDDFDVEFITETYNEIREDYENAIDEIINTLTIGFSDKFYSLISKMLDQSLLKIENFIK